MADLALNRRSFTEQDLIEAQRLLAATGYSLNGLNTSSGGITEQSGVAAQNDPAAVNALLGQLQGYQWDRVGDNGVYAQDTLYSPGGANAGSVSYMPAHDSMVGKDYQDMATVLAAVLGGGYALSGAGAGAGVGAASGGTNAAIANGAVMGGATGAGVGGATAAGYGGLAAGAGSAALQNTGSQTLPQGSYNELAADGSSQVVNTNSWAPQSSGSGSSLADFFSGNGSTSDYMRAGQALYGMYSQNKATDAATAGNQAQMDLLRQMWEANQAENKPLVDMRNSVLPQIQNLLQNPSSITQDPSYQFGLQQGQNSLNNRAAASGNYYSGAQMKANSRFNQDYASSKLDQSINRLMGVATGTQIGSQNNQAANQQFAVGGGNALQQGGNIRAGGYIGQYNTVNNNVNDWMQDQTNRKYWGGGG